MNKCEGIDLPRVMHVMTAEIATLLGELYRWMDSEAFQPNYEETGVGMDHLRAAALQLSIHTAYHLEELIDWENSEHGVFSYDYCECEIPSLLKDALTPEEWYQMAGNYVVPSNLRALLRDWVMAQPELELKVITPWIPCECCDDFVCTVHEQHAWECTCPTIDVWVEAGYDPYLDDVTPELKAWVADNPIEEED